MATFKGKAAKSPRRAMDVTFKVGNYKKYYKSNMAAALEDFKKLAETLYQTIEVATPLAFLEKLKQECANVVRMVGSKKAITQTAEYIRRYMSSYEGQTSQSFTSGLVNTGKMIGDALVVGQRGKGEDYEFWVGFSATHKSLVGTRWEGMRYADLARQLQENRSLFITQKMRAWFNSIGMPISPAKKTFYTTGLDFATPLEKKAEDIVEAHLYNNIPLPATLTKAAREIIG